jgi:uncharacterized membrane protein YtjA (UPF0391 family)
MVAWQLLAMRRSSIREEEQNVIQLALLFLILALVAGVLGLTGIAGISANIAWILFVVGLILAVVTFALGRRPGI